jgi:hypothetical protein
MTTPSSNEGVNPDPDRRGHQRGRDRRREAWRTFRHGYPTFLKVTAFLFLMLLAFDIWLFARHFAYRDEVNRLRASMTQTERERSDLVIRSEKDKLRVALELAKRQAQLDPKLHLSISVDSGRMYLLRDGAMLRDMVVSIAPEQAPHEKGDTAVGALPRGERTVIDIVRGDTVQLVLNGGTRIYASADTTATTVAPGNVRANPADLKALLPNVSAGMSVYFY